VRRKRSFLGVQENPLGVQGETSDIIWLKEKVNQGGASPYTSKTSSAPLKFTIMPFINI